MRFLPSANGAAAAVVVLVLVLVVVYPIKPLTSALARSKDRKVTDVTDAMPGSSA